MKKTLIKSLRIFSAILLIIVAVNALAAGYSFIVEPSGNGLGIKTDYLRPSAPFTDYLIPGIILFVVNGLISIVIAVMAFIKSRHYGLLIALQGGVFMGWIIIQLSMVVAFHPLHLIIGLTGLVLAVCGSYIHKNG